MASTETGSSRPAAHPTRALFLRYVIAAAVLGLISTFALASQAWIAAGWTLLLAGGAAYVGLRGLLLGPAVQLLNTSYARIVERKYPEAEAILGRVEATSRASSCRATVGLQRAIIAMRRGKVTDAIALLDASIAIPTPFVGRAHAETNRLCAHGIRALLHASRGEGDLARADMAAVASTPHAPAEAHAYAALAEAMLIEQSGDRPKLRAHLEANGSLLFETTGPRERAIARAYQRMLKSTAESVYRKPHDSRHEASDEPDIAEWIAAVAPRAAPFVREARRDAGAPSRAPTFAPAKPGEPRRASLPASRPAAVAPRQGLRVGLLWMLLIGMFVAIWQMMAPHDDGRGLSSPGARDFPFENFLYIIPLTLSLSAIAYFRAIRTSNRDSRALTAIGVTIARGDHDAALAALAPLQSCGRVLTGASADLMIATIQERRGELHSALATVDRALARFGNPNMRAAASDLLYPEIIAERAFVLAALDRPDEAEAELAQLAPPFPMLERAVLRVRVIELVRRGDLEGAARLVEEASPDIGRSRRDELLGDLLRARFGTPAPFEVERLKEELRTYVEGRKWIERVAPAALEAFEKGPPAEVEAGDARASEELEAEAEAAAMQEAAEEQRSMKIARG